MNRIEIWRKSIPRTLHANFTSVKTATQSGYKKISTQGNLWQIFLLFFMFPCRETYVSRGGSIRFPIEKRTFRLWKT